MTDASNLSNSSRPAWKKWLKKIYFKKILFKNAAGFLISGSVNENFYKEYGVPKKKMIELHYSYGYEDFLTAAKELKLQRQNIRKYSGIKDNDFVLLFVGRLDEVKNIFTLLKAYKGINYKNKKLFIVGDGPLRPQIEKYIKDLKIQGVNLKGFQQREYLINFYIVSDALVLPSTDEPWGMVINEAMCFGLPIIASDKVGAAVDLVQDGYNGFIFPSENIEKLADCIEKLINLTANQRQIFGGRSFEIINKWVSSVDPEQQMIKTLELLKNI
jgi:glycosyltransferase involved in cell wall biosynthesis